MRAFTAAAALQRAVRAEINGGFPAKHSDGIHACRRRTRLWLPSGGTFRLGLTPRCIGAYPAHLSPFMACAQAVNMPDELGSLCRLKVMLLNSCTRLVGLSIHEAFDIPAHTSYSIRVGPSLDKQ